MDETGIKDKRLQRLMKAARNAGGTIDQDRLELLQSQESAITFFT